ncbi:Protein-lysine N-methyltransferase EFM3 [Hondaea fermentalgiana]|uniref:Protein unc-45 homolog B n=1 Tax=Hondaea fermentalgiana TaxID=2315210 RepID=A0A2R5G437_9STRA|nr:Protein-lysine N-methyltransferase EFM3 [Hondaea fermentalgiana]|eukprot:GBG25315.1 Protein-lysine N-methyltransferase EFM3 [Hondaea fermentalgiana]
MSATAATQVGEPGAEEGMTDGMYKEWVEQNTFGVQNETTPAAGSYTKTAVGDLADELPDVVNPFAKNAPSYFDSEEDLELFNSTFTFEKETLIIPREPADVAAFRCHVPLPEGLTQPSWTKVDFAGRHMLKDGSGEKSFSSTVFAQSSMGSDGIEYYGEKNQAFSLVAERSRVFSREGMLTIAICIKLQGLRLARSGKQADRNKFQIHVSYGFGDHSSDTPWYKEHVCNVKIVSKQSSKRRLENSDAPNAKRQRAAMEGHIIEFLQNVQRGSAVKAGQELEVGKEIVTIMRVHIGNEDIQEQACAALWNLAGKLSNKVILGQELEVGKEIVAAMRAHPESEGVQLAACGALWSLASEDVNKVSLGQELEVGKEIVAAMRKHLGSKEVQIYACAALCNLANNDQNQVVLGQELGVGWEIVAAMRAHPESEDLQMRACVALGNLAGNEGNKVILGQSLQVGKEIVEAMQMEACRERGNALYRAGDHAGAELAYGEALAVAEAAKAVKDEIGHEDLAVWRAKVLANRAQTRLQLGWIKGAIEDCREAVMLDGTNWKAQLRMVKALEAKLDFAEALKTCDGLCERLETLPPGVRQLVLRKRTELRANKKVYRPPPLSEMERRALFSEHHTLRLFLGDSSLQPVVQQGTSKRIQLATFIGNEFGLLDRSMLPEVPSLDVSVVGPQGVTFAINERDCATGDHGRTTLQGTLKIDDDALPGQLFQLRVSAPGVEPVLTPPSLISKNDEGCPEHEARFAPFGGCREVNLRSQKKTLYLLEATSSLGIAGKLWDSAARMLGIFEQERYAGLVSGRRVLELGAGTGAVGIGCALLGASHVSVTDLEEVVSQMEANIVINKLENARALPLAWGPSQGAKELDSLGSIDTVLLSDVVYDPELYGLLLWTLGELSARYPAIDLVWGHRHRNPADHEFFAAFAELFEVTLVDGPGAGFLVPEAAMTPSLEALQQTFRRRDARFESDDNGGNDNESVPTHASRDVSVYHCKPARRAST